MPFVKIQGEFLREEFEALHKQIYLSRGHGVLNGSIFFLAEGAVYAEG
jgi:hypothetical protein